MDQTKTISDLMAALTKTLSERDVARALIKADISRTITNVRINAGLSQAELAKSIGKTQSTISKWEAGDTNFTVDSLVDIAADLDLDLTIKLKKHTPKAQYSERPNYQSTAKIYTFPTYCSSDDLQEPEEM